MRRQLLRLAAGLSVTATATAVFLSGTPAHAATTDGLVFYNGRTEVASFPAPDGRCQQFPSSATALVGWSGFRDVVAYRTADCTGQAVGLGTLRGFPAGTYRTFLAS